jgi:hypothetical protein
VLGVPPTCKGDVVSNEEGEAVQMPILAHVTFAKVQSYVSTLKTYLNQCSCNST